MKAIKIFEQGEKGCNHKFVYDDKMRMNFTTPPTYTYTRVCEHCGRIETVEGKELLVLEVGAFEKALEKFENN